MGKEEKLREASGCCCLRVCKGHKRMKIEKLGKNLFYSNVKKPWGAENERKLNNASLHFPKYHSRP